MTERLIACEMLRDELELAMERTGVRPETIWLDRGLHDRPEFLRATLQDRLDHLPADCTQVLLALSYCGGALQGVGSRTASVAVPLFDDCIRMLLSLAPGQRNEADCRSLYFTRQWMDSDRYLLRDLEKYQAAYGKRKGEKILRAMLANYREIRLVDTGAYDAAEYAARAERDAARLGLACGCQCGSVRVLEKLLRRQFDEEICVIAPGEVFTQRQFLGM